MNRFAALEDEPSSDLTGDTSTDAGEETVESVATTANTSTVPEVPFETEGDGFTVVQRRRSRSRMTKTYQTTTEHDPDVSKNKERQHREKPGSTKSKTRRENVRRATTRRWQDPRTRKERLVKGSSKTSDNKISIPGVPTPTDLLYIYPELLQQRTSRILLMSTSSHGLEKANKLSSAEQELTHDLGRQVRECGIQSLRAFAVTKDLVRILPTFRGDAGPYDTRPKFFKFEFRDRSQIVAPLRRFEECFEVRANGEWLALSTWLSLGLLESGPFASRNTDTGDAGYDLQMRWWSTHHHGNTCRLMSLPAELRDSVYRQCLGFGKTTLLSETERYEPGGCAEEPGSFIPLSRMQPSRILYLNGGRLLRRDHWFNADIRDLEMPDLTVARLNRRIRREVEQILWSESTIRLTDLNIHSWCLQWRPSLGNNLRKLILDLEVVQWLQLFGVPGWEGSYFRVAERLPSLATLRKLVMFFRGTWPSGLSPRASSWHPEFGPMRYGCLVKGAHMALAFGFDYYKDVPEIYIEGFVKTVVKLEWQNAVRLYKAFGAIPDIDLDALVVINSAGCECYPKCWADIWDGYLHREFDFGDD